MSTVSQHPLNPVEEHFVAEVRACVQVESMPPLECAETVVWAERDFRSRGVEFRGVAVLAALYPGMVWSRAVFAK